MRKKCGSWNNQLRKYDILMACDESVNYKELLGRAKVCRSKTGQCCNMGMSIPCFIMIMLYLLCFTDLVLFIN